MDMTLSDVTQWLVGSRTHLAATLDIMLSLPAAAHAVLRKRDSREATAWVAIIFLAPIVGSVIYVLLGINRIQRRAHSLRAERGRVLAAPVAGMTPAEMLDQARDPDAAHLAPLEQLVGNITKRPLAPGNTVVPLINGDAAYPAMIDAIDAATHSITFCTYIFDKDRAGKQFLDAFRRAMARGVQVRVLIDDVGARYSWPTTLCQNVNPLLMKRRIKPSKRSPVSWMRSARSI